MRIIEEVNKLPIKQQEPFNIPPIKSEKKR